MVQPTQNTAQKIAELYPVRYPMQWIAVVLQTAEASGLQPLKQFSCNYSDVDLRALKINKKNSGSMKPNVNGCCVKVYYYGVCNFILPN